MLMQINLSKICIAIQWVPPSLFDFEPLCFSLIFRLTIKFLSCFQLNSTGKKPVDRYFKYLSILFLVFLLFFLWCCYFLFCFYRQLIQRPRLRTFSSYIHVVLLVCRFPIYDLIHFIIDMHGKREEKKAQTQTLKKTHTQTHTKPPDSILHRFITATLYIYLYVYIFDC